MRKAQQLVCNDQYQNMRDDVNEKITEGMDSLIALTRSRQSGAEAVFTGVYRKIELCAALLARCRIAPQKNEKQARRSWKLRLFSNKRPLRILLDFKSMNPRWLLQFPYAALIMIVYYCHSCMYFRKKAEN